MSFDRPKEVTAYHLAGSVGVYVRLSSERQVEESKGSIESQRNQVRLAKLWGWSEDQIRLFEDLGLSGAASEHRAAFLQMLEEIKAKRLRVVFASDQSRLARNTIEWFKFLELCRSHNVLIVLDGRILSLGDGGDGFSSRIMALVDEFENEKRLGHVRRGIIANVQNGKAVSGAPTGYIAVKDGKWELDPDPAVQAAISEVFRVFLEERSVARAVRRLRATGQQVPRRAVKKPHPIYWVDANLRAVLTILRNPVYSGTYVFRRRVVEPSRGRDRRGQHRVRVARPEEQIVVPNHHAGYISPERQREVREILRKNAPSKTRRNLGPGSALLQGLIKCGRHDERSMSVDYKERLQDGRNGAHYYHCLGLYEVGGLQCGAIPGRALDLAVARSVFSRVTTPSLEVMWDECEAAKKNEVSATEAHAIAVRDAERRVDDLRRRYLNVSPALRDLAEDVEIQLNKAIGDLKRLKAAAISEPSEASFFTKDVFDELIRLCSDLPGLFCAATTLDRDRKEILRTLVERVVVTGRTPETISALVYWADGSQRTPVEVRLARYAHRLIRELADQGLSNVEIAKRLIEMGLTTSRGKPWTRETVWVVRFPKGGSRASKKIRKAS